MLFRALAGFESMHGVDNGKTHKMCNYLCRTWRAMGKQSSAEHLKNRSTVTDNSVLLGTLNCLGEGYNPVEFMNSDSIFLSAYNDLENYATCMTWAQMERLCQDVLSSVKNSHILRFINQLREYCKHDTVGEVWSYFTEEVLKNDNKYLEDRLNMLTLGMQKSPDGSKLQWQLNGTGAWRSEMVKLAEDEGSDKTYKRDPNLFLWDLACNVVASSCAEKYAQLCEVSHLNPDNFPKMARGFVEGVVDAAERNGSNGVLPILLGMQEWPRSDTAKGDAFRQAFEERKFKIVDANAAGVALAYLDTDELLGRPSVEIDGQVDERFVQELMQKSGCGERPADDDEKAQKIFKALQAMMKTTRQKVLAVRFEKANLGVVIVHSKEPKTATATALLAEFICEIGRIFGPQCRWVGMADTNISTSKNAGVFVEELHNRGLMQVPMLTAATTAKRRSLLHGQCYDVKKSLKLVTGPKDKIISTPGSLRQASIFPDLSDSKVLPSLTWASDHALVTAIMCLDTLTPCHGEVRSCLHYETTCEGHSSRYQPHRDRDFRLIMDMFQKYYGDGKMSATIAKEFLVKLGAPKSAADCVVSSVPSQDNGYIHVETLVEYIME
jgi:hypothetical protein